MKLQYDPQFDGGIDRPCWKCGKWTARAKLTPALKLPVSAASLGHEGVYCEGCVSVAQGLTAPKKETTQERQRRWIMEGVSPNGKLCAKCNIRFSAKCYKRHIRLDHKLDKCPVCKTGTIVRADIVLGDTQRVFLCSGRCREKARQYCFHCMKVKRIDLNHFVCVDCEHGDAMMRKQVDIVKGQQYAARQSQKKMPSAYGRPRRMETL